jgi:hypothetical protein
MRLGADVGTLHEASNRPTGLIKDWITRPHWAADGTRGRGLTRLNLWGCDFREPSAIALASRAIWAVSRIDYLGKGLVRMGTCE